jgi:transposase
MAPPGWAPCSRQINAAIHRIAVTRARCDPHTQDYIARKKAEGKTNRDAIRCLKRHLARRVWNLLRTHIPITAKALTQSIS